MRIARCLSWLLLGALAACSGTQSSLDPAGDQADSIHSLFGLMLWICGLVYVAVMAFLVWSIWRASRTSAVNLQIEPADRGLGRGLWVWAIVVVVGLTTLAIGSFFVERSLAGAQAREALEVRVTAHQWWWRIEYRGPGGHWIETANELHLPAGRTARIVLGSADVIHSFWVPNVAGKMDVIPGRANAIDVSPHRIGWFRGQCAEFCGAQHAHMAFDVKVESPADFAVWLATQSRSAARPSDPVVARGMTVLAGGQCGLCHAVRGTTARGRAGPDLTHVGARRSIAAGTMPMSRGALQGWIAQPQGIKPGTLMPAVSLPPADADAVSRYLVSLK
jgi:cytochrome c oxidase subunit 2